MSIRSEHKTRLKQILEGITIDGDNLDIFEGVKTTHTRLPYAFITSADMLPNIEGSSLFDSHTYNRIRKYDITIVFYAEDSVQSVNAAEIQIDDLEELVLNALSTRATRNDTLWQDVIVESVSAPIQGAEVAMEANYIVKTISIAIQTIEVHV